MHVQHHRIIILDVRKAVIDTIEKTHVLVLIFFYCKLKVIVRMRSKKKREAYNKSLLVKSKLEFVGQYVHNKIAILLMPYWLELLFFELPAFGRFTSDFFDR